MPKVFISYRRDDEPVMAQLIRDKLADRIGSGAVFFDVDSIPFGVDFRAYLNEQVSQCDVLLAIIGRHWLNVPAADDTRRIDDPADFVRIEIEAALSRTIPVIPVLVGNTLMPKSTELPESLESLAFRHAAEIRPGPDLYAHLDRLISSLEGLGEQETTRPDEPSPLPKEKADEPPIEPSGSEDDFVYGDEEVASSGDDIDVGLYGDDEDSFGSSMEVRE